MGSQLFRTYYRGLDSEGPSTSTPTKGCLGGYKVRMRYTPEVGAYMKAFLST